MSSQSPKLSSRRRRGTGGLDQRTTKQAKTPQTPSLFRDIVSVPIEDTSTMIPARVEAWMRLYKEDGKRDAARAELCNFIFEACGMDFSALPKNAGYEIWYPLCAIGILYYDVDETEVDIINLIGSNAMRDYITMVRHFPNLKINIKTFWDCFIKQSQNELFFFDTLSECMKYHITLSCHLPTGYNKMPILMALQTMSSLVFIAKAQGDEGKKADSHMKALEHKMTKFFQGFFLRIYNNDDEELRVSCLEELQKWTDAYPTIFLKTAYQKCFQVKASAAQQNEELDAVKVRANQQNEEVEALKRRQSQTDK